MIPICISRLRFVLGGTLAVLVLLFGLAQAAEAATPPVKLKLSGHFGRQVNKTTSGNVCTIASKDECQPGLAGSEPVGFEFPQDVAGAPSGGDIYVADAANNRIQEITATGEFVLMFGEHVNKTTGLNVCTQEEITKSKVECQKGVGGAEAGALTDPSAVAVDPVTGNVYIAETSLYRVEEYSPSGQFILMIGREVDETTHGNVCTLASKDACKTGVEVAQGSSEHSAFAVPGTLAAGGPEDLLYVGDIHRVQEFKADGTWAGELRLPLEAISSQADSRVTSLAIDPSGDTYLVYSLDGGENDVVRVFNPAGDELAQLRDTPQHGGNLSIKSDGIALDSAGHLAVAAIEEEEGRRLNFGTLFDTGTRKPITEFVTAEGGGDLGFNSKNELYSAVGGVVDGNQIDSYEAVPVAELVTVQTNAAECEEGPAAESDATLKCTLSGTVNPEGVAGTSVWFQWGRRSGLGGLGSETPRQLVGTGGVSVPVQAVIEGLRPNEEFSDRLAGIDSNLEGSELLSGITLSFATPPVPPRILSEPRISFVTASSAVMFAELNPENAATTYAFEYGPCEDLDSCSEKGTTASQTSSVYGRIGTTLEASELKPGTTYHYRLTAERTGPPILGTPGEFTTSPAAAVQATTGASSAIETTSAVISGAINPAGQPATYSFEVGIDHEGAPELGVVASGSVAGLAEAASETFALAGLQPGTRYAYRIVVHNGFSNAQGAIETFTTTEASTPVTGPPAVSLLQIPSTQFPTSEAKIPAKCKRGYHLDTHGKCIKTKKKKTKKIRRGKGPHTRKK